MSEAEKRRRQDYKRKRKGWILLQAVILVLVLLVALGSLAAYYRLNRTYYIAYTEKGSVDYRVQLMPNDFYEEEWQGAGQSYVASLMKSISADFAYDLVMDADTVSYEYAYRVDAKLLITDNETGVAIYQPTYAIKEEQRFTQSSSSNLAIRESVSVDFAAYNARAEEFIDVYKLSDVSAVLLLSLHVDVEGNCNAFEENSRNDYEVVLRVPLTEQTVNMTTTATVPESDSRVLACSNAFNTEILRNVAIVCAVLAVMLAVVLIVYVLRTRNHDINYAIRVKKIVSAYRSFIQQIENAPDVSAYQVLTVKSFTEMLGIRDTINAPILMHENEDQTCTCFYIPTATSLLYVFEIKVEDYDEIYGTGVTERELEAEHEALAAAAMIEPAPEAVEVPTEQETGAEDPRRFDFGPRRKQSFEAKIELAPEEVKGFYTEIKAFAESYGVKVVRSQRHDRIYKGKTLFAILTFKGQKLAIAFALDPKTADPKYHAKDMSEVKRFEKTPMLMRVTSQRKVKYAMELLAAQFSEAGIERK